jgi:Winged helix-turn-helix domain (DUF2582)
MAGKSAVKAITSPAEVETKASQAIPIASSTATAPIELKQEVGFTAGRVWHTLSTEGPLTLAQLRKRVDTGGDLVSFAVGWLAREDKVEILPEKRSLRIALR